MIGLPYRTCYERGQARDDHREAHDLVGGQVAVRLRCLAEVLGEEPEYPVAGEVEREEPAEEHLSTPQGDQEKAHHPVKHHLVKRCGVTRYTVSIRDGPWAVVRQPTAAAHDQAADAPQPDGKGEDDRKAVVRRNVVA